MSPVNHHLELPTQWSIHPVFHIDFLTPYHETPTHSSNYQCPSLDLVDREEEYEVKKILDSWQFGRKWKLQYLVKWKGYPDLENQWVDKNDVFADKALQEFKSLNPASEVHIRHLHIPEDCIITSLAMYMSSPTSLTIENVIIPSGDTQDYPISHIFGQLIEPKCGWVFPNFMEYQDPGVIDTAGDQEGASMEEVGTGVEAGATHQSLPQLQSPVSITTVSDISDMLCTHNCPAEYCHDHQCYPVFIPPPESRCIACNILQHAQEAHEAGIGPIVGYTISGDDSNKENGPNAAAVPPQPQGQGMGS